jgi:putative membrane-bound dehydrogenase-like protein
MRANAALSLVGLAVVALIVVAPWTVGADAAAPPVIPHGQDQMPGPPLSPAEAIRKMSVPEGFSVELVAGEPDIVNPVAMTFDEQGRIWITESVEYPRHAAGPGRDRIKVLESTKGDGHYDKITVFADGLNIPSGIAVSHGGVWVANAPDILFYRIGADGKAAGKPEVIVTGFGRLDTHELPNSLTWGPDGWLYGLNGVFNPSHIRQNGKEYHFTCALFRIHPRTHEFQLFCEGTSNPWGLAWDIEGSAFVSACVIDHLWHLTETGYYLRQGGPYPPFTWWAGSIVHHRHQKAAYCGMHFFDSDAYPPEYRERLYMGNIHGGCINVDVLRRDGSTYAATPAPDFLRANDPWFMPVAQKTGPDGCLYILDWYDRYHCYQDANRDPAGIDRERGRLYRIRYRNTPAAGRFDLGKESDDQLIDRLHSPNVYFRDIAQRLLCERANPETRSKLENLVLDDREPRKARMHALWALVGGGPLDRSFHARLLAHPDAAYRAWAVRAAGNAHRVDLHLCETIRRLARDGSPDVQLQVAIASRKLEGIDPLPLLLEVAAASPSDPLIPHIVWQNLHPLLESRCVEFLALLDKVELTRAPNLAALLPHALDRILARHHADAGPAADLLNRLCGSEQGEPRVACACLEALTAKLQNREIPPDLAVMFSKRLGPSLSRLVADRSSDPLHVDAVLLAATLGDLSGLARARGYLRTRGQPEQVRLRALDVLVASDHPEVLADARAILSDSKAGSTAFRGQVLTALSKLDRPQIAAAVLAEYPALDPELQPRAIELLTQRTTWGRQLLQAIRDKRVSPSTLNANQIRRLLASRDAELARQARAVWGAVRTERNPERERVVADMRGLLRRIKGKPTAGAEVFKKVCAQCHTIYGHGQDVGPDLTANGRGSLDQLLSNVFDPSLVIGAAYQATTVTTTDGRVLTGLLSEDSPRRVVLKTQGGKVETIPRDQVDEVLPSKVSLMPEGLEKQMTAQEIADLFAFLCLDRPPGAPGARRIPGAP